MGYGRNFGIKVDLNVGGSEETQATPPKSSGTATPPKETADADTRAKWQFAMCFHPNWDKVPTTGTVNLTHIAVKSFGEKYRIRCDQVVGDGYFMVDSRNMFLRLDDCGNYQYEIVAFVEVKNSNSIQAKIKFKKEIM